jgi:hypothetical protein
MEWNQLAHRQHRQSVWFWQLVTFIALILADGLRADKLFEEHLSRAKFLSSVVETRGTW